MRIPSGQSEQSIAMQTTMFYLGMIPLKDLPY